MDLEGISMAEWLRMTDTQRERVVQAYLGDLGGADRAISYGHHRRGRPSHAEVAEMRDEEAAYPDGDPKGNWSGVELRAFIDAADAQIAALPRPVTLNVDDLTDQERAELLACTPAQWPKLKKRLLLAIQARKRRISK